MYGLQTTEQSDWAGWQEDWSVSAHNSVESDQCPGEHGTAVSSVEQEQSRQQAKLNMDYTHCNYLPPRKWNIRSIQVLIRSFGLCLFLVF